MTVSLPRGTSATNSRVGAVREGVEDGECDIGRLDHCVAGETHAYVPASPYDRRKDERPLVYRMVRACLCVLGRFLHLKHSDTKVPPADRSAGLAIVRHNDLTSSRVTVLF